MTSDNTRATIISSCLGAKALENTFASLVIPVKLVIGSEAGDKLNSTALPVAIGLRDRTLHT